MIHVATLIHIAFVLLSLTITFASSQSMVQLFLSAIFFYCKLMPSAGLTMWDAWYKHFVGVLSHCVKDTWY